MNNYNYNRNKSSHYPSLLVTEKGEKRVNFNRPVKQKRNADWLRIAGTMLYRDLRAVHVV